MLCNTYFATFITLALSFLLTKVGYSNIWPLFGSANQLLSALVLITLCVFMKVTGRSNKMLFPPLIIMLCVTFTALVQRLIGLIGAIQAGSATFVTEGLQLIIAVLLIVLGVIIVVNSLKSYFEAKRAGETPDKARAAEVKSSAALVRPGRKFLNFHVLRRGGPKKHGVTASAGARPLCFCLLRRKQAQRFRHGGNSRADRPLKQRDQISRARTTAGRAGRAGMRGCRRALPAKTARAGRRRPDRARAC